MTEASCRDPFRRHYPRADLLVIEAPATAPAITGPPRSYREVRPLPREGVRLFVRGRTSTLDTWSQPHLVTVVAGVPVQRQAAKRLADWAREEGVDRGGGPPLDGQFAGAVLSRDGSWVLTDYLGNVPVYQAERHPRLRVWGTHLYDVARVARRTRMDGVSAREFLAMGVITSPHTIFEGVVRVEPATAMRLDPPGERQYWRPSAPEGPSPMNEAAAALCEVVDDTVTQVADRFGSALVLMSGGEDSRVVAALAARSRVADVSAVVLLDRPNRELRLAKAAAHALRVRLEPRWRPPDLYTAHLESQLDRVGPGIDLRHAHTWGLVSADDAGVVLDGMCSDTLVKAYSIPTRRPQGWPWKPLVEDTRIDWRTRAAGERPMLYAGVHVDGAVAERRAARMCLLRRFRPEEDACSWLQRWPASDNVTYGFFATNRSSFTGFSPFMTRAVVDAVAPVHEADKIDRALFRRAFRGALGLAGLIPRSDGEWPGLEGWPARVADAATGRLLDALTTADAAPGPWQDDHDIAALAREALTRLELVPVAEALSALVGPEPWEQVTWHPAVTHRFLQLATLQQMNRSPDTDSDGSRTTGALALTRRAPSVRNSIGHLLWVDPDDPRGAALVESGGDFNPPSLAMWRAMLVARPWDLVIDVGANYGEMLLGAEPPSDAELIAFEPNPAVRRWLEENLRAAGLEVRIDDRALADVPMESTLVVDPAWSGTAHLRRAGGLDARGIPVRVTTLDKEFRGSAARRACIKIDVEGAEHLVLRGGSSWLRTLDDYACLVEILHMDPEGVATLTQEHAVYLWDMRFSRFVRVAATDASTIERHLSTGAFYPQDALVSDPRSEGWTS